MNISELKIHEIKSKLDKKEITSVDVVTSYIENVKKASKLNAFVKFDEEKILINAKECDKKRANNENLGVLNGIPVAVKDLFCTEGEDTTACSKILSGFNPIYSSTVTNKLVEAGAVLFGKTNMDEFAMGSSNETSAHGFVYNPYSLDGKKLSPGGSSGGSAAAVAAKLAPAALGTDTGGSIRQPASLCGLVGIKPTYGRCSRYGIVAFASSLDQAGILAQDVKDTAILLNEICGHDKKDATSSFVKTPDFCSGLEKSIKGLKIGIPNQYRVDGMPAEIDELWQKGIGWLKDAGCEIKNIDLNHTKYALPVYYIIAPAEASSNLARYDGIRYGNRGNAQNIEEVYVNSRTEGFGNEVKRRIMIGTYVLSAGYYDAYYLRAQKVRKIIYNEFMTAFDDVDAILTPTTPDGAFEVGTVSDPVKMYLNDIFTVTSNLTGLPALSVPAGFNKSGLPLGLQLIGKPFDEESILNIANIMEKEANFKHKYNKWWE